MLKFIEKFETMRTNSLKTLVGNQTARQDLLFSLYSFSRGVPGEFYFQIFQIEQVAAKLIQKSVHSFISNLCTSIQKISQF